MSPTAERTSRRYKVLAIVNIISSSARLFPGTRAWTSSKEVAVVAAQGNTLQLFDRWLHWLYRRCIYDGLFDWDTPIWEYLPRFRQRKDELGHKVTLADLLSNRSGLSGQATYWGQMSYEWLLRRKTLMRIVTTARISPTWRLLGFWQPVNCPVPTAGATLSFCLQCRIESFAM